MESCSRAAAAAAAAVAAALVPSALALALASSSSSLASSTDNSREVPPRCAGKIWGAKISVSLSRSSRGIRATLGSVYLPRNGLRKRHSHRSVRPAGLYRFEVHLKANFETRISLHRFKG
jgi:hypothetical protein